MLNNQHPWHSHMQLYKDLLATHQQRVQEIHATHAKMIESYHSAMSDHLDRTVERMESMLQYVQHNMKSPISCSMLQSTIDGTHHLKQKLAHYKDGSSTFRKHAQRLATGVFSVLGLSNAVNAADDLSSEAAAGGSGAAAISVPTYAAAQGESLEISQLKSELAAAKTAVIQKRASLEQANQHFSTVSYESLATMFNLEDSMKAFKPYFDAAKDTLKIEDISTVTPNEIYAIVDTILTLIHRKPNEFAQLTTSEIKISRSIAPLWKAKQDLDNAEEELSQADQKVSSKEQKLAEAQTNPGAFKARKEAERKAAEAKEAARQAEKDHKAAARKAEEERKTQAGKELAAKLAQRKVLTDGAAIGGGGAASSSPSGGSEKKPAPAPAPQAAAPLPEPTASEAATAAPVSSTAASPTAAGGAGDVTLPASQPADPQQGVLGSLLSPVTTAASSVLNTASSVVSGLWGMWGGWGASQPNSETKPGDGPKDSGDKPQRDGK